MSRDYSTGRDNLIKRNIPSGVTADATWVGKAMYESAVGESQPISAITQRPIGICTQVDTVNNRVEICRHGYCKAKPGAGVDLSAQLAAHGAKATSAADGRLVTPASTSFYLGEWEAEGESSAPTADVLHPFFVNIADVALS